MASLWYVLSKWKSHDWTYNSRASSNFWSLPTGRKQFRKIFFKKKIVSSHEPSDCSRRALKSPLWGCIIRRVSKNYYRQCLLKVPPKPQTDWWVWLSSMTMSAWPMTFGEVKFIGVLGLMFEKRCPRFEVVCHYKRMVRYLLSIRSTQMISLTMSWICCEVTLSTRIIQAKMAKERIGGAIQMTDSSRSEVVGGTSGEVYICLVARYPSCTIRVWLGICSWDDKTALKTFPQSTVSASSQSISRHSRHLFGIKGPHKSIQMGME